MKQCDFCIIRNDYGGQNYLYAMTDTVDQALDFVSEFRDELVCPAVEVCVGSFPCNGRVVDVITKF